MIWSLPPQGPALHPGLPQDLGTLRSSLVFGQLALSSHTNQPKIARACETNTEPEKTQQLDNAVCFAKPTPTQNKNQLCSTFQLRMRVFFVGIELRTSSEINEFKKESTPGKHVKQDSHQLPI